ncbi:MAG: hypothetical protein JWQ20_3113 [Conexibacter sp.]|nr:hypothetical protein [Conexibacter sp.]
MTKAIGHALGWLFTAAILAVGPSVATGDTPPSAQSAGSGGGNGNCNDNSPPSSNWGNGWYGRDSQGAYWNGWGDGNGYFDGSAHDSGCGGGGGSSMAGRAARTGKVDRVMVAVKRLSGAQCQHLFSSGRLSTAGSCRATHWMRAKGAAAWHFDIPKELPKGNYQLHRVAVDAAGNHERQHLMHLSIR